MDNICNEEFLNNLKACFILKSRYFRIDSQGKVGNTMKNITVVYDLENDKVVSWHEN